MSMVEINWRPSAREMRRFGLSNLVILSLVGLLFFYQGLTTPAFVLWGLAGASGLLCGSGTRLGLPLYIVFMAVGFVVGNVVSRLVLVLFYYGMITPFGLVMRLIGRDRLCLRRRGADTYWHDVDQPSDPSRYQRQF